MVGMAEGQSQELVRGTSSTQSGVAHERQTLLVRVTVGQPSWEVDEDTEADDVRVAVSPDSVVVGSRDEVDDAVWPWAGMLLRVSVVCWSPRQHLMAKLTPRPVPLEHGPGASW